MKASLGEPGWLRWLSDLLLTSAQLLISASSVQGPGHDIPSKKQTNKQNLVWVKDVFKVPDRSDFHEAEYEKFANLVSESIL